MINYPTLSQGARLTAVHLKNEGGEEIGRVIEWMIDVSEGRVIYVVAELNDDKSQYHLIPWKQMHADLQNGGYMVDDELVRRRGITADANMLPELVNEKRILDKIFDTYGVPKYWEAKDEHPNHPGEDNAYPSNAKLSEGKGYGG